MVAGKKPTGSVRTSRLTICGCGYQWQPVADGLHCAWRATVVRICARSPRCPAHCRDRFEAA